MGRELRAKEGFSIKQIAQELGVSQASVSLWVRQAEIEQFWLDQLVLTQRSLRRSVVNVYSLSSKRKRVNMLPNGTCRVCVS